MSNIKRDMIHGVFWSAVEKYSGLIVSIVVSMILARLLSPEEFGTVAVATVVITFFSMFCSMGIGPAIIQRDDLSLENLNSIYTFTVIIGLILAAAFFGGSWLIADFYKNEQLIPICQILSIQIFFSAANMVPNALMSKNKLFKDIAKRSLVLQLSSGLISIFAAWFEFGVYSLLIAPVLSAVGIFIWNKHYFPLSIQIKFDIEPIKRIFSFSSYQFLFEFINYFSRNLDKLIIGRIVGIDALGIYEQSYRLMQLPMSKVTSVINPVMQPVLRDLQNDKKDLNTKYLKIVHFITIISFPMGIILAGCSTECIRFFYGHKWDLAIPVFQILALSLPLQMVLSTSGSIFLVCNNTKMQFILGLRNTLTTITGFICAAVIFKSIIAMAWAWTITLVINFVATYILMYKYVLHLSIKSFALEFTLPLIEGCILVLYFYFANKYLQCESNLMMLVTKGGIGILISILFSQTTGQMNILSLVKKRTKR